MESTRQQKFAKLIQKELTDIFLRDGKEFYGKAFVTVTQIKMTPDLSLARIHLSILGTMNHKEVVTKMNDVSREIRGKLGAKIKNQVRHIPSLEFFLDESLDYAANIERLLKDANTSTDNEEK